MPKLKTLIIDNYDSFTWNLYQYIGEIGGNPLVKRNDELTFAEVEKLQPTHIIISPGPGRPEDPDYFGVCLEVILNLSSKIPTLGVCLGHQGICHAFGGKIVSAPKVMHGKTSYVHHDGKGIFKGIKNPLTGMRYHSLIAERKSIPKVLKITAIEISPTTPSEKEERPNGSRFPSFAKEGVGASGSRFPSFAKEGVGEIVMAVEHISQPLYGIQFHPESIGTPTGKQILKNFLRVKGKASRK